MKSLKVLILFFPMVIVANPLITGIINEFETDTLLGQKIEFHFPYPEGEIPLYGTEIRTSGGNPYIDTAIFLLESGYATIEQSVLSGPFFLNLVSGDFGVYLYDYFTDRVYYPDTPFIPTPQPGTSVSRYFFYKYQNPNLFFDWYLDRTPTFGSPNDDYPGCRVSGYVYIGGNPAQNAQLIADCIDSVLNAQPYYTICTTYTQTDGFYEFDSLVPFRYWVSVYVPGFSPTWELTPVLHASRSIDNFNFTFQGIEEYGNQSDDHFSISPNPFRKATTFSIGQRAVGKELKIYDINGRLVKNFDFLSGTTWNGEDIDGNILPAGVYICRFVDGNKVVTRKIVKLK